MKVKRESEVTQSCQTLSDPIDCSPPGSSVHGIFLARVLEWVAIDMKTCKPISSPMRPADVSLEATGPSPKFGHNRPQEEASGKHKISSESAGGRSQKSPEARQKSLRCGWVGVGQQAVHKEFLKTPSSS